MDLELRELTLVRFLNLLSHHPRITTRRLIRFSGLPQTQLYSLLKKYSSILLSPSRHLQIRPDLRQTIYEGTQKSLHDLLSIDPGFVSKNFKKYAQLRPSPDRSLDQFFATPATTLRRLRKMIKNGDIQNRDIAILGDDDLTSLAIALTKKAKSITVFEIDPRLIKLLSQAKSDLNLDLNIVEFDLQNKIPQNFSQNFDTIFTDPPYTPGGISLFISQALRLMRPQLTSRLYLCYGNSDRAREREVAIQTIIADFHFLIHSKHFQFNYYLGAQSIGSRSSLYLLDWTPQTKIKSLNYSKIYTHD